MDPRMAPNAVEWNVVMSLVLSAEFSPTQIGAPNLIIP
jgi:hypothetical protein